MAEKESQSGHFPGTGGPAPTKPSPYPLKGAMNMHKRLAMGNFDVQHDPQGMGAIKKGNITNDKKGY